MGSRRRARRERSSPCAATTGSRRTSTAWPRPCAGGFQALPQPRPPCLAAQRVSDRKDAHAESYEALEQHFERAASDGTPTFAVESVEVVTEPGRWTREKRLNGLDE